MLDKYFYNLSVTIVGIVTAIFILTTVGGLFHIPVNPFFVLIPFIGGLYYLRKQSPENIDFFKTVFNFDNYNNCFILPRNFRLGRFLGREMVSYRNNYFT